MDLCGRCDPEQFLNSRSERNSSRESIGILPIADSNQDSKSLCDWSEAPTTFSDTSQNSMLQVEAFPYLIFPEANNDLIAYNKCRERAAGIDFLDLLQND